MATMAKPYGAGLGAVFDDVFIRAVRLEEGGVDHLGELGGGEGGGMHAKIIPRAQSGNPMIERDQYWSGTKCECGHGDRSRSFLSC